MRIAGLLSVLLFLAAPASAHAATGTFAFHSDVRIAVDGQLTVTETITVQARGSAFAHGILRDFPTEYTDRVGATVRVPFDVWDVRRDGRPEPYALETLANGVRIRIGAAAVALPRGEHVYRIRYRTARQIGFFEKGDELYWNVNGTGWTFGFDRVTATVTLPSAVPLGRLGIEAYTGRQGMRGRDYEARAFDGGATFGTTRALGPHEGMTIVLSFPKGIVTAPSTLRRAWWWLAQNPGVDVGVGGLVLLVAFLGWRWSLIGRDPRAGPTYPRYEAPPGLGPAGVRYVDRMAWDNRCFAAALLGLGSRGHLRVRQKGGRYLVERTGKSVDWLPGERELSTALFGQSDHAHFGKEYSPAVSSARESCAAALQRRFGETLFSRNRGSLLMGLLIAVVTLASMLGLSAPGLFTVLAGAAMVIILILFAVWLPAYSVEGRRAQDAIEGLRLYLGVAEADELRRMKMPEQTPQEFAQFLPYAIALNIEKTWADRFAAVLGAAAVAAAVSEYYQSDRGDPGDTARTGGPFVASISALGMTVAAASSPPGSASGSSGGSGGGGSSDSGGSSGGGGGGGGGSDW